MGIVLTTPPEPDLGADRIAEARELLGLGYIVPAAFSARSAIEAAVKGRLYADQRDSKGHKEFKKLANRIQRGYEIANKDKSLISETYRSLSEFLHGRDFEVEFVRQLIGRAGRARAIAANAEPRDQLGHRIPETRRIVAAN